MPLSILLALLGAALALVGAALVLRSGNAPPELRYRQWWSPLLVLLYAWLVFRLQGRLPGAAEIAALLASIPGFPELGDGAVLEILQVVVRALASQVPLLLIVLYLPLKRIAFGLHRLVRRWSLPAFWFYVPTDGTTGSGVVLRPEWTFSRLLFGGTAWVALTLLLVPVAGLRGLGTPSPLLPALAFVLLAETAWFLGGREWRPDRVGVEAGADAASVDLDAVVRESKALFGPWLLAEERVRRQALPAPGGGLHQPCDDLALSGWSDACCLLLDDLAAGESVVVEGALPQQVEPCLGYHLRDRVLRGGRILVLAPSLESVASARSWTERLLQRSGWPVLEWEEALVERPAAVVATLHHDLYRLLDESWGPDIDTVLLPDAHAGAYWFAAEVHALIGAIMDRSRSGGAPQVIAFADWRVNNEGVLRNLFGVAGRNRQLGRPEVDVAALVWRSEGRDGDGNGFQDRLFSAINTHVTPEVALAYPAARAGGRPQLVGQGGRPAAEAVDEAHGAAEAGQIDAGYTGPVRLVRRAAIHFHDWEPPLAEADPAPVIAYDLLHNLPATLRRWLPGPDPGLVEVVSPPYLYRDLFAARLALETAQPRRFTAFGPGGLSAEWATAFTLFRRLERGWVDLERIRSALRDAGLEANDVPTLLTDLFARHLALPGARFVARSERRFDPDADPARFALRSELRLSPAAGAPRRPPWLEVVDIVGRERDRGAATVLARVHRGHLHQLYLPGQTHVFGGRPYRIERVDEHGVAARWIDSREWRSHQRQIRRVRLAWDETREIARLQPEVAAERTRLRLARLQVPLTVVTDGDYRWRPHDALDLGAAEVFRDADVPERHDPHGKVLHVRLDPPAELAGDPAAVELALAALLNEAMPSYYPEAHPFVMVVPVRKPPRHPGPGPDYLDLLPGLEGPGGPDGGVLIVEDSPFDLGVLQGLWDALDDVLADLADYLAWRSEIGWEDRPFALFGPGAAPVAGAAPTLLAWLRALP